MVLSKNSPFLVPNVHAISLGYGLLDCLFHPQCQIVVILYQRDKLLLHDRAILAIFHLVHQFVVLVVRFFALRTNVSKYFLYKPGYVCVCVFRGISVLCICIV